MRREFKAFAQILLALVFLALGIFLCAFAYRATVMGLSGDRWVSASTTITYTYSTRPWASITTKQSGVEYVLYPSYSFVATDGKTYHGNQYSIYSAEDTYRHIGSEEKLKERLIVDGKIYYNPDDPWQSAVEQPFFIPLFTLGFGFLGIFLLVGGVQIARDIKRYFKK